MLSFAAPWMDLENIMLSEIKSENINTIRYHSSVESKNNTNVYTKQKQTDTENKIMVTKGEREGRDKLGAQD